MDISKRDEEYELLHKLIQKYVLLEKANTAKEHASKFHSLCMNIFTRYRMTSEDNGEIANKSLLAVRDYLADTYTGLKSQKVAEAYKTYFYRKFLDEIKAERKKITGSPYSKKTRIY